MAFKAILKVGGEERTLLTYHNYLFDMWGVDFSKVKELNPTYPTLYDYMAVAKASPYAFRRYGEPLGGLFDFTMESTDDDEFFYHWFKSNLKEGRTYLNHGVIELYDSWDEFMPMRRIEFWDAWITEISEHHIAYSNVPMILGFTLSPATIRVNKQLVFQKNWKQTDINQQGGQTQQQTELFVSEIKWRGKKDNYVSPVYRKDLMLNHGIDLEVITKDYNEGESFELTVKQSNGRRIKGQSTEFSVSGSVDADGLATISNFQVECDFQDDNQNFGDIIFYHKDREVARFKENFGWTYIKEGGITKVFVNMELLVDYLPFGCLESDIKDAMDSCFRRTLENSSGGIITGKLFYSGTKTNELPQFVPNVYIIKGNPNGGSQGGCFKGNVTVFSDLEETPDFLQEFSETIVHELFHVTRIDHPFERTQSEDTKLFSEGWARYSTALSTDPMIYYNIMNYNYCIINGKLLKKLWANKRPEYLTKGQLQLMLREIDLQKTGEGTKQNLNVGSMIKSGQLSGAGIDILHQNNQNPDDYSYLDYYWTVGVPGKVIDGYMHRETRNKPR
ncbi:type VI secretion system tube protein TssD [Dysgonomonas sp. ZJ709]|uniref:type VI secretion system tube protein TssD n=1 Tax=Dysgonomonas sp. ZJ709 TaxID=2709797 RepID=UPI0013E9E311|nr:type VI secretion system tube protein TssD [Dysgonomonas sp. ZJ709]